MAIRTVTRGGTVNRRQFVRIVGGALVFVPLAGLAQKAEPVPRIGLLWVGMTSSSQLTAMLREGLRARGYDVGRNISIDDRSVVNDYDALAAEAERLVREKVSVIVVSGSTAVQAARKATSSIPIVMVAGGDPVRLGVAASLARPGGNVTGFTTQSQDLAGKRLGLLREIVPSMRRLAVILYPGSASEDDSLRNYQALARPLQLEVRPVEVRSPAEIEPAIMGIAAMNTQAIVVVGSSMFSAYRDRVVAAVAQLRVPAMYSGASLAEAGGLVAFAPNVLENSFRAAVYIDKILKGARAADLPIEQPSKWELIINLKTAKALGLTFPPSILLRADRVIE